MSVLCTATWVASDDLDMLIRMGWVETNTAGLVGILHAARTINSNSFLLGVLGDRQHDG